MFFVLEIKDINHKKKKKKIKKKKKKKKRERETHKSTISKKH